MFAHHVQGVDSFFFLFPEFISFGVIKHLICSTHPLTAQISSPVGLTVTNAICPATMLCHVSEIGSRQFMISECLKEIKICDNKMLVC